MCADKPLSEVKVMVTFHKSISQVLSAANVKYSNRCSQAARDIDFYLVKQYLSIMKKIPMFNFIFLKNAAVELLILSMPEVRYLNHDI